MPDFVRGTCGERARIASLFFTTGLSWKPVGRVEGIGLAPGQLLTDGGVVVYLAPSPLTLSTRQLDVSPPKPTPTRRQWRKKGERYRRNGGQIRGRNNLTKSQHRCNITIK